MVFPWFSYGFFHGFPMVFGGSFHFHQPLPPAEDRPSMFAGTERRNKTPPVAWHGWKRLLETSWDNPVEMVILEMGLYFIIYIIIYIYILVLGLPD